MPDPFKRQFPKDTAGREFPADIPDRKVGRGGAAMAREGYSVLERANPRDTYDPNLKGVLPPVTDDMPNVAWDEEK